MAGSPHYVNVPWGWYIYILRATSPRYIFGSDRSPRRDNVVCACVCPSVRVSLSHFPQKNTVNEFLKHSIGSRGVLGQAGKQAGGQASKHVAGKQAGKQAGKR